MRFAAVALSLLAFVCPVVCGADTPAFVSARPVWPTGSAEEMNGFVRLVTDFDWTDGSCPVLRITGSSVYRISLNGAFLGYGPARAAKGWFRVDEWPLSAAHSGRNRIEIEVSAYNCRNYYIP